MRDEPAGPVLRVLGGLGLTYGAGAVAVPPGSRRLLAYLALHPGGVDRRVAAGVLWPAVSESRAAGNLRSELWRLQAVGCPLLDPGPDLRLAPSVVVDLVAVQSWA